MTGLPNFRKTLVGLAVILTAAGVVGASGNLLASLIVTQAIISEVPIDIKPGSDLNPINPNSIGKIPVALLSTPGFDATAEVDKTSLTFGRTGSENSFSECDEINSDVNGDGLDDLVCKFNTHDTDFQTGDAEGVLRGILLVGAPFESRDSVIIVGG